MAATLEEKETRPTLAIAADGALGVAHIDAFVAFVARQPLNEEQMNKAVGDIVGESSYLFSSVKNIIINRHQAGRYDASLAQPVDPRDKASITRNLARIGITL